MSQKKLNIEVVGGDVRQNGEIFDLSDGAKKEARGFVLRRRNSLINDAMLETAKNREFQEIYVKNVMKKDLDLTSEEAILLSRIPEDQPNMAKSITIVLNLKEILHSLPSIFKYIESSNGRIEHVETRKSKECDKELDILLKIFINKEDMRTFLGMLRQCKEATLADIEGKTVVFKDIWFPRHIYELDRCSHVLSKVEPDLDSSHPGFSDSTYRERRKEITQIAFEFRQGLPIPKVQYTEEETNTWRTVYQQMMASLSQYACSSYQRVFRLLEEECGYCADAIPQLQDVSAFLKRKSGFVLRPAAGLISARDFLASLAFRVFQCTQYIRHSSRPDHTPEPDCIHELLGHVPMLADPEIAKFSQEIGLASLGASDEDIEKLSTIYWFTIEFGLCKENGKVKAYGAGLLSSYGELQHAFSGEPQILTFEPENTTLQPYQDLEYQDVYFVSESFESVKNKIRTYINIHLKRNFEVFYDPYTESIKELSSGKEMAVLLDSMKAEILVLSNAIQRLKS